MNEEMKAIDNYSGQPSPLNDEPPVINESRKIFKENFPAFGIASLIYAVLYALCIYENKSGIAYVVFTLASVIYIRYCFTKLNIEMKRGSIFYILAMMLLAVATFCTDDGRILALNKTGIFMLAIILLIDSAYSTGKWKLVQYIASFFKVCVMAVGEVCAPFDNVYWYFNHKWDNKNSKYLYAILGVVVAIPVVGVVFALLSSADAVFRELSGSIFGDIDIADIIAMAFMVCFMFMASYCVMAYISKKDIGDNLNNVKRVEALVAIPVTAILTVMYLVFSVIQIVYLFVGKLSLPAGYTYAQYAREGFFQLLAVGIFNLIIVVLCISFCKENKLLKGILTVMSMCTFIMIASSAVRMLIYIQYYYLTFLRIFVLFSSLVLFIIFIGLVVYIHTDRFPFFKYSMVVVTVLYICLAFSHPDYIIAKVNLSAVDDSRSQFFLGAGFDDYEFMEYLSADAAPAISEWMKEQGYTYDVGDGYINDRYFNCNAEDYGDNYMIKMSEKTADMGIRDFNLSLYRAKCLLGQ